MNKIVETIATDTKKLGRIVALVVVLGVAAALSIKSNDANALDSWMDLAKTAVMFYFLVNMANGSSIPPKPSA